MQIFLSTLIGVASAIAAFCFIKAFMLMGPPRATEELAQKWAVEHYVHLTTRKLCRNLADDPTVRNELFYYNCLDITQAELTDLSHVIKGQ